MSAEKLYACLDAVRRNIHNLNNRDQVFAFSLLEQFDRRGTLSEKQTPWLAKLATKASGEEIA